MLARCSCARDCTAVKKQHLSCSSCTPKEVPTPAASQVLDRARLFVKTGGMRVQVSLKRFKGAMKQSQVSPSINAMQIRHKTSN